MGGSFYSFICELLRPLASLLKDQLIARPSQGHISQKS